MLVSESQTIMGRMKLAVGAKVEVESEADWWDAEITEVTSSHVKVFYVGGSNNSRFTCTLFIPVA